MASKGATTIWELWNGDTAAPDMNSMNHLMLVGDLVIWYYENLAGIKCNPIGPGFKDILIRPTVTGDLTSVKASHESPHGKIATSWERSSGSLSLNVSIPVNTTATVYVPASNGALVKESGRTVSHAAGIRLVRMEDGAAVYQVGSGHYAFTSTL
jgi:alpha-L-rhamnosidase